MTRENEYEIVAHHSNDQVEARLWWDGKRVRSDDEELLKDLKEGSVYGNDFEDSKEWLNTLPRIFKSGYTMARKAKARN